MTLLVFGATGVVGGAVVDRALQESRVSEVVVVTRRPLARGHARLRSIIHADFSSFTAVAGEFHGVQSCIYTLGMPWPRAKSKAQYREVTHDYAVAAAQALASVNPSARFCFVSGHGAGRESRQAWARIKAETEDAVTAIFGAHARIFRPGYIYPVRGRETAYWGDAVMRPFMAFRRQLAKYITDSDTVARALVYAALGGDVPSPAVNLEIQRAAEAYARGELQISDC